MNTLLGVTPLEPLLPPLATNVGQQGCHQVLFIPFHPRHQLVESLPNFLSGEQVQVAFERSEFLPRD